MRYASDPLPATFLERPNRFLGVVDLDGARTMCFIPNPGRMYELMVPGASVYLVEKQGVHRKTGYDMVLVDHGGTLVSVDSRLPNALLAEAIKAGAVQEFKGLGVIKTEPPYMDSRFDLLLSGRGDTMILEAKSCTLVVDGLALFPDAPTLRGARHMRTLARAMHEHKAAVVFIIQRSDAHAWRPHREMDPVFSAALTEAVAAGVKAYAYRCQVALEGVKLGDRVPIRL